MTKEIIAILSSVLLFLTILIYIKVDKKCNKQGYSPLVKDIGPSAGGNIVQNPPQDFVTGCQNAFASGCASNQQTVNVCGGYDGNGNMIIGCQDYTNMDDTSCSNSSYVAYQASDCTQPYQWTSGYLCGGSNTSVCPPLSSNILGTAPNNPYGCTNICG